MRYLWGALCKRVIIDDESKKLSVIDVLEQLTVTQPIPSLAEGQKVGLALNSTIAAVFWCGEEDEPTVEVRAFWSTPDGERQLLGGLEADHSERQRNSSARILLEIEKVEYRGPGLYHVELEMRGAEKRKWHRILSYPVVVKLHPSLSSAPPE